MMLFVIAAVALALACLIFSIKEYKLED